jgi:hypothetical protein
LNEALTTATTAVQIEPQSAASHAIRAVILSRLQRRDDSVGEFQEAARLEPGNARHHFNLASQLSSMGRKQEALAAAQEAQRLDPILPNLAHLLQQLQTVHQPAWDPMKTSPAPTAQTWTPPRQDVPSLIGQQPAWTPRVEANTSGQGSGALIPYGIGKWNWGAFALTSIWALCMRLYWQAAVAITLHVLPVIVLAISIAKLVPEFTSAKGNVSEQELTAHLGTAWTVFLTVSQYAFLAGIAFSIWLGISGSGMAWRARRFQDIGDFQAVQKAWNTWGIVSFCILILSICCAPFALGILAAAAVGGMGK